MTRISMRDAARLGGILAGTGVLFVGGLLVASSPALADNGVHISTSGNMTVDRCAGLPPRTQCAGVLLARGVTHGNCPVPDMSQFQRNGSGH